MGTTTRTSWTRPSRTRSRSPHASGPTSPTWPAIGADALVAVREPPQLDVPIGPRRTIAELLPTLRRAVVGCEDVAWSPPAWLMTHQVDAARRLAGALAIFRGALLADAVGLGKTYVALALATRMRDTTVVAPASLIDQWRRTAERVQVGVGCVSHEVLSRGHPVPPAQLIVVDEAHRFRNPATRRYDALARGIGRGRVLLLTATPVVNRAADLVALLRLFLADHALAPLGVPSLERAVSERSHEQLLHAITPFVVARSSRTGGARLSMPVPRDARIVVAPTVGAERLHEVVRVIDRLRFPSFGQEPAALLRQHILHRLASSAAACGETLRHHARYLERAIEAARRGVPLPRASVRALFGGDMPEQLDLGLFTGNGMRISTAALDEERRRVADAIDLLRNARTFPKTSALARVLRERNGRKTIVFTSAIVTARALAWSLGWNGIAVVTGRGARIASGAIPVDDALDLFAPRARRRRAPPRALTVATLIATDLAGEGLDLQDADAIVHFDLPWNPYRLEQRLGRIARLGSTHRTVEVWWFAPAAPVERRLALAGRVRRKLDLQLALVAPHGSAVGRARVLGGAIERREAAASGTRGGRHGHAIGSGAPHDVVALRWTVGMGTVRELVQANGAPGFLVWETLARAPSEPEAHERADAPAVARLVRRRVTALDAGPCHVDGRRLVRSLLDRARDAARTRNTSRIALLDAVLLRVHRGVPVGAERELTDVLSARSSTRGLRTWLRTTAQPVESWAGPTVEAIVFAR